MATSATPPAPTPPPPVPPPPPDATFSIREAAREAGVTIRTIRYYVQRRALPTIKDTDFKSIHTRYDRAFLVRLRAIARLRTTTRHLEPILARIDAATPDELLDLAGYETPPPPAPTAPAAPPAPAPAASTALPPGFAGPYRSGVAYPSERWEHLAICPGVVLLVKTEADAEAARVAREIVALFGRPDA
jgi:DNA-binding transcriptional MerR regulator